MHSERVLYARFDGPEIFLEQGRILFSLLNAFASSGYTLHLHTSVKDKPLERYAQRVHELPRLQWFERVPDDAGHVFYLTDRTADQTDKNPRWRKRLQVRFDLFSPFWREDPIIMPYYVYPLQAGLIETGLQPLRDNPRRMRVFFAGDCEHYRRVWIRHPTVKLPREPIVQFIRTRFAPRVLVQDAVELARMLANSYVSACVLTASSAVRIDVADWLPTLAQADFFLCPPGIVMPMSHNIIEAMAVGTIPITNYPEWMDPPLRHGVDCLAFDTLAELESVLRLALALDAAQIAQMRSAVIDYYERYLRPQGFVARIEQHPAEVVPILIYTERNVALHSRRLGRHSILMQGSARPRPQGVLRRMAAVYLPNLYRALELG
ncbi:MAG: hypothetical protein RMK60_02675 [Burkholderiales bacterium]|nr:hypothetical protein [Burkholderiales bacterium]